MIKDVKITLWGDLTLIELFLLSILTGWILIATLGFLFIGDSSSSLSSSVILLLSASYLVSILFSSKLKWMNVMSNNWINYFWLNEKVHCVWTRQKKTRSINEEANPSSWLLQYLNFNDFPVL